MSIVDFSIFLKLFPQAIVQCGKKVHKGEKVFHRVSTLAEESGCWMSYPQKVENN